MPDAFDNAKATLNAALDLLSESIVSLESGAGTPPLAAEFREPWERPAERPPFHGFGAATSYVFLVKSAVDGTMSITQNLVSTSKAAVVVNNYTTGTSGTVGTGIAVVVGYNWVELIDTTNTASIVPFNYDGSPDFQVLELYVSHTAANLTLRPVAAAFASVTAAVLATNAAYNNTIDYFYYEGPKTSWNYCFSGMRNLKKIEILSTATAAVAYSNTATACPDLLSVKLSGGTYNLSASFKHLNLGDFTLEGTASVLNGFLSYSKCATVTLNLTAPLTAANTLFAGSKFGALTGTFSLTNTAASTLAFFAIPMAEALALAHTLNIGGAGAKTLQFGFGNGFDAGVLSQAIEEGYILTIL